MNDLWLIWSNEHGQWWMPNCHGYTASPEIAGRFSYAKACQICRDGNYPGRNPFPNETMVRVNDFPRLALQEAEKPCDHSEMVENKDDPNHVWKCIKCGYVFQ